ncbi:YqaA family protein [Methylophaga muralis]|uniref:SNARE associated Golgi protein n=1 Tax=Methylophaga muralis TaxID=291169 RepID=A0A1E3GUX7_9GAMM|nr:VTT domain-containing protein [Methylophaga muralis]ODN67755.1 SNARE associated Golgi protein [Methylophaga muralis]
MERFKKLGSRLVNSKHMLWGVAFASFMESLIVPIPLETILIPLMQARREMLWAISAMALWGCMVGAALGYAIGYFVFGLIGEQIIALLSTPEQFESIRQQIHLHGFWYVLSVGITPIPFQIAMLAAGATGYAFLLYMLATTISRGLRYFGLGLLVCLFGNQAQNLFEEHKIGASIFIILVIGLIWSVLLFS